MKLLPLSQGMFSKIDDEDFERLSKHHWSALRHKYGFYGRRGTYDKTTGKKSGMFLHREIMNAQKEQMIDHINGDTLDNRKENLRFCTPYQNSRNIHRKMCKNATSKYIGVDYQKHGKKLRRKPWRANIKINGKNICLGFFTTELEAHLAYQKMSKEHFND